MVAFTLPAPSEAKEPRGYWGGGINSGDGGLDSESRKGGGGLLFRETCGKCGRRAKEELKAGSRELSETLPGNACPSGGSALEGAPSWDLHTCRLTGLHTVPIITPGIHVSEARCCHCGLI